jgi:phosphoribosylamine-glycine ligase
MCVTGIGSSVHKAMQKAYRLIDKIVIPRIFFRNDIGLKFIERDKALLEKWGYM